MKFIKKYFKVLIGCGVLIVVLFVFVGINVRKINTDFQNFGDWRGASIEQKQTAIRMMKGTDDVTPERMDAIIQCVNTMGSQSGNETESLQVLVSLCNAGLEEYL